MELTYIDLIKIIWYCDETGLKTSENWAQINFNKSIKAVKNKTRFKDKKYRIYFPSVLTCKLMNLSRRVLK